jgi:hypothetical protein
VQRNEGQSGEMKQIDRIPLTSAAVSLAIRPLAKSRQNWQYVVRMICLRKPMEEAP